MSSVGKYLLLFIHHHLFFQSEFIFKVYQMLYTIWCHFSILKNVKNTHGGMSILVKLQAYFIGSNTLPWVFSHFLNCINGTKLCNASLWKLTASDKVILSAVLKWKNLLCKQHSCCGQSLFNRLIENMNMSVFFF